MNLSPGFRLGPFEIVASLGAGGMGEVYRARDLRLEREVAVKSLPAAFATDPAHMARFLEEAKLLASLNHPRISALYGLEESATGERFLILELVDGETLAARLKRGPLPVDEALIVAAEIAEALEGAHARSVIHRDLKPGNVMLTPQGVKLLDFGLARRSGVDVGVDVATATGTPPASGGTDDRATSTEDATTHWSPSPGSQGRSVAGTAGYMSPEQIRGEVEDARSDLFAFGCVLFECLIGRRAFPGRSMTEAIAAVLQREPEWSALPASTPPRALDLLRACLAKDPQQRPAEIREVRAALQDLRADSAARRNARDTDGGVPNNLPTNVTRFIGRESVIEECGRLLAGSRLLTLTGVGGGGKTRLALRLAEHPSAEPRDGIWFVDLAPLTDPERVAEAVAVAVGAREEPGRPVMEAILDTLRGKQALLILDNCEHLLAACGRVAEQLLLSLGGLRILATSREALGIAGEQVYRVPSLAVPPATTPATSAAIGAFESVLLFVERSRLAVPDFQLDERNASAVAEVVRRVDGIPLAIELAAARVRMLTVEQICERLGDRFRLLTGPGKTMLARHQTLRATIQWSYDLLHPDEQDLFRSLAVFAGGWDLAAALAVHGPGLDEFGMLDELTRLVDKSLVVVERGITQETRYRLLDTIRQYAREKLEESGTTDGVRDRHLGHFLGLAVERPADGAARSSVARTRRFEVEHENFLEALAGAGRTPDSTSRGLQLVTALWRFWEVKGYYMVGRRAIAETLALPGAAAPTAERSRALHGAGFLATRQGDYEAAHRYFEENLEVARRIEDRKLASDALNGLAVAATYEGDLPRARGYHEQRLVLCRELGDPLRLSIVLNNLGNVLMQMGDFAAARPLLEESAQIDREAGDGEGLMISLGNVSLAAMKLGDLATCALCIRESAILARDLGALYGGVGSIETCSFLAAASGDPENAARLLGASIGLRERGGLAVTPAEQAEIDGHLATIRSSIGEERLAAALAAGRELTLEGALDETLRWLDGSPHGAGR